MANIIPTSTNVRPKRVNPKPGTVKFDPRDFDNLIEDQGTFIRLTPAVLCPNQSDLYSENHVLDCPLCFGTRVIDIADKAVTMWAFIQGIKLVKESLIQGIMDIKDATITFQAGVKVYYQYKIEVLDFSSVYNQMIMATTDNFVRLRYNPAASLDTPFYMVDKAGERYEVNVDYEWIPDQQRLNWLTAHRPAPGTVFSFSYPILPTFRVVELLHDNRYYYNDFKKTVKQPVQLPQQALLRWDYLLNQTRAVT